MPSEIGTVHIIDDDEAVRQSLTFLLRTAQIDVQSYASAAAFSRAARNTIGMCDYRRPHARHQRN